ncbi:membrane protein FAM174 [Exaiptasia diaphana]|uniref:Uncharacterized protein n=1 Tax=Exaiptasia diaphana TaxID=2652724 RepID=A0A913XKY4_EXADI|nr:membrane protein FAM174 [Exaiptasia diaphana]KXJ20266.1 Membrane protein FAM174 [Exaiptasia diaphana]
MAITAIKWLFLLVVILCLKVTLSTTTVKASTKTSTTAVTNKSTKPISTTPTPTLNSSNDTQDDRGSNVNDQQIVPSHKDNKGLLKRMLYVAIGFSVIVALYFIVKTIRTKARKSKSKKYGMIYSSGDVEMQPLEDNDDEEDDMTVFDRKTRK